jgi:uncharacterized protein YbjQ (UPF0145 family)
VSTESPICTCGLVKVDKFGTRNVDGRHVCNRCNRPLELSGVVPGVMATSIAPSMVTTLDNIPGHRIVAMHGLVSAIASDASFTAATKGRNALGMALPALLAEASRVGGNALVGVQASPFGARGGITGGLGGDAVGVLLIGTAVTVETLV